MMGDIHGWGAFGGSKEARLTLKHTLQTLTTPALQVRRKSPPRVLLCANMYVLM